MAGVRALGAVCAIIGVVAVLWAWLQGPPELDRADAREVVERALAHAGFDDVAVGRAVLPGTYVSDAHDETPVWETTAEVDVGTVELHVARANGLVVFLRDLAPDGTGHLLTDAQYERLRQVDVNPQRGPWLRRSVAASAAAMLIVPLGTALTAIPATPRRPRRRTQEPR
jgi:hypothetical protein